MATDGMEVLRRDIADGEEFVVTTYWESLDAVRLFAGDDAEQAVVTPAARALMVTCGERASHYGGIDIAEARLGRSPEPPSRSRSRWSMMVARMDVFFPCTGEL